MQPTHPRSTSVRNTDMAGVSWVHVQRITVHSLLPSEMMTIKTLTAFDRETRAVVLEYPAAEKYYGVLLPSATAVKDGTAGDRCRFITRTVNTGTLSCHVYTRIVDCRLLADTAVSLRPMHDAYAFESMHQVDEWLETLEECADCMAAGILPHCTFEEWYDPPDSKTVADLCAHGNTRNLLNALVALCAGTVSPRSVRRLIDRESVTQLVVIYIVHQASRAQLFLQTAWQKIFRLLFLQMGLDGRHHLVSASRSANPQTSGNEWEMPFEDAVRLRIDLRSGTMRYGTIRFAPLACNLVGGPDEILSSDVTRVLANLDRYWCTDTDVPDSIE
jgi:hypothetical protein